MIAMKNKKKIVLIGRIGVVILGLLMSLSFLTLWSCRQPPSEMSMEPTAKEEAEEKAWTAQKALEEQPLLEEQLREQARRERKKMTMLRSEMPMEHSPPDSVMLIDRILQSMEWGNIAFNAPRSMNLKATALIQLVLDLAKPIEELKQMIVAEGEREGAQIRISSRMEARLSGSNFQITAITPEEQAITSSDVTEWKWEIKPTSPGRQHLHLTLTALFTANGISTSRAIRTFDKTIEVEVTWGQKVSVFLHQNWQWLWMVIIVPIAGWLWKKRRKIRMVGAEKKDT